MLYPIPPVSSEGSKSSQGMSYPVPPVLSEDSKMVCSVLIKRMSTDGGVYVSRCTVSVVDNFMSDLVPVLGSREHGKTKTKV